MYLTYDLIDKRIRHSSTLLDQLKTAYETFAEEDF